MTTRFALFATQCCLLCAGVLCVSSEPSQPPARRDSDLLYDVGGGVAGSYHAVRITPEGQVFVSDEHQPEVTLGFLSNKQGNQLNALLEDWDTLSAISEEPVCCDGFGYGISYRGRTLSWFQGQENVPEQLREIAYLVWSAENDLRPD